jgi:hypothetical protein
VGFSFYVAGSTWIYIFRLLLLVSATNPSFFVEAMCGFFFASKAIVPRHKELDKSSILPGYSGDNSLHDVEHEADEGAQSSCSMFRSPATDYAWAGSHCARASVGSRGIFIL